MAQAQPRYLRPGEVSQLEDEVKTLDAMLADPTAVIQDRSGAFRRRNAVSEQLKKETPPDTTDAQKDVLVKREVELRQAIQVGMPSDAVMRRMPNGAVSQYDKHRERNKRRIQMWKNIVLTIHKGTTDNDVANVERLRPLRTHADLNLGSGQVGGTAMHSFPSDQFTENFDQIDWRGEQALDLAGDVQSDAELPVDRAAELVDEVIRANDLADLRLAISDAKEEAREATQAKKPEKRSADALG